MIGEAGKNWTAASQELILTAVSLDSSSQGGLCISLSSKELTLYIPFFHLLTSQFFFYSISSIVDLEEVLPPLDSSMVYCIFLRERERGDLDLLFHHLNPSPCEEILLDLDLGVI
jgi:hypothetical protein